MDTPAVRTEYAFWREVLHERYNDFERFCVNIQQPVYNTMIARTNDIFQELEDIQVLLQGYLVTLEDDMQQAEEQSDTEGSEEETMELEEEEDQDGDEIDTQNQSPSFRAHALIPMMTMMLERFPRLSFKLCPTVVAPLYNALPDDVSIIAIHEQMILLTREFGGGGEYIDQWQSGNLENTRGLATRFWNPYPFIISPRNKSVVTGENQVEVGKKQYKE
ncbi:hypothetical protein K492DRAFT_224141 [Lichtheimia hyalospora FSU 10163]|nr:hypothetical protein K492DRAFT_224141 [Lichtheimia hyalospora FSU 10163]